MLNGVCNMKCKNEEINLIIQKRFNSYIYNI